MPSSLWFVIYNLALLFGLPFLGGWLLYRKVLLRKGEGWSERLGASPRSGDENPAPIWVHAVSAGEVAASVPLLRALEARLPGTPIVLSTLTPAGKEMANRLCPNLSAAFYFPWDFLPLAGRSLRRVRPQAVILMEAEFWPNFLFLCRRWKIPVIVANGRISDKGYRRAHQIKGVMQWIYSLVSCFGMQTSGDAQRARALGAPSERIKILGQTKFDQETQPLSPEDALALRREMLLPDGAVVMVGGSTRPGEEEALLTVLRELRPRFPTLRLIVAPRHLERVEEVETLALSQGWRVGRRTRPLPDADVLLLDTMGELGRIFALADVSFVGGTLANIGGHNLLQPVAQGKPVFFGPHTQNVRDLADLLIQSGVGFRVENAAQLVERVEDALTHPEEWHLLEDRALQVVEANKGASERYVDLLLTVMERPS